MRPSSATLFAPLKCKHCGHDFTKVAGSESWSDKPIPAPDAEKRE